jgi:L-amino acid N-acyltransferase YncA
MLQSINDTVTIAPMKEEHWPSVRAIYEKGIQTGNATFQTAAPALWAEWHNAHVGHSRLVALLNHDVVGWVALSPVSTRDCYKGVCEFSIYVDPAYSGKGIGNLLMEELVERSEANGIWTLYSSTFPENKASIALQKKYGFREIGYREKIAQRNGIWRDTVLFERRSKIVGNPQ